MTDAIERPYQGGLTGKRILRTPEIDALRRAHEAGTGATELARIFRISRRTVYRWVKARIVEVEVDGWRTRFALRPADDAYRAGPIQLEEWRLVDEVAA